jgi:hypothetical protein
MEMDTKELWRTDDMALATYLIIKQELDPELVWESQSCFFLFPKGESLLKDVTDFVSNNGLVDARTFNMTYARLRKATFEHPDSAKKRRQRR